MMIKRNLKHCIVDLYDFEYGNRKYTVYLIENELHVAYNINNKKAFCSVFHCNLLDKRGIADTLELFSYMGNSNMMHRKLIIDNILYEINATSKTDKILSLSRQYEFVLDRNNDKIVNVEELTGTRYKIDTSLYPILNAIIIIAIIIWINVSSNLIGSYKDASSIFGEKENIITLQPDSCIYRYCIIPVSNKYMTLNVIGNSPYHSSLITDYDSDGVYELREVKICTIVSQSLVPKDLVKNLYDKIKSVSKI